MQRKTSNKTLRILGAALLAVAMTLTGCASETIRADYDSSASFGEYTTYNFYEAAGPRGDQYQGFFSQYMIAAITIEMEKRGYMKSSDPDLLINFNAILQEKTQVRTTPAPMMGGMGMGSYYGYRSGYYDPWPTYGYGSQTHVSQYTEGTVNIDLVDARRERLVWEAVGKGRVSQKTLEDLQINVMEGVPKYFSTFPFTAGVGTPAP